MRWKYRNSVVNKIIVWTVLFSLVFSGAATVLQLYLEYQDEVAELQRHLDDIEQSYLNSIRRALWTHDTTQLENLASGIFANRDIVFVEIREQSEPLVTMGTAPEGPALGWSRVVTYPFRGEVLDIGHLTVSADLSNVRNRVFTLGWRMFLTNAITTALVAIFAYFVFARLVTRHLRAMARYLGGLGLQELGPEMTLDRRGARRGEGDELDMLVDAFNGLRSRLRASQRNVEKGRDELRASESRYRAILDEMLDTFYRTDRDGVITMVSPSVQDLLGWRPEELIGTNIARVYDSPDQYEKFKAAFRQGGGAVKGYEAALRHKDGRVLWVSTTARVLRDDSGYAAGTEGIARDINEQREAAEAIRNSRNQLRLVADSVPALILYVDREMRIRFINREGADWYARSIGAIIGAPVEEVIDAGCYDRLKGLWEPVFAGEPQHVVDLFHYPDGKSRRVDLRLVPHRREDADHDDAEAVTGFFALGLDMTARFDLEERLRQSQKMESVGQLTGGVAHDFNNLLGVILGNVELLIEEPDLDAQARAVHLAAIQRAGDRGASLTRQLLAFSRMQPLEPRTLMLGKELAEFVSMLRPTIGEAVDIEVKVADGLWPCRADRGLLESALLNLAINSRDAMPQGGRLTIALTNVDLARPEEAEKLDLAPGPYVAIAVTDDGIGVPEHQQQQVFEPFFTTKDVGAGTGLGLSMVYGFATQSGGQVALDSEEGVGTTVTLYLPAERGSTASSRGGKAAASASGQGERVLVVEDDDDLRALTVRTLTRLGYTVVAAEDGPSALALAEAGPAPDLVLSDIRLPNGLLGPEVVRELRRTRPHMRAVYMTGFADPDQIPPEALAADEVLLTKPFRKEDLARTLRRMLAEDAGAV